MTKPKYNIGDEVVAVIKGRVTAITEYANGYYSYRVTGTEPTGDRYNKFIDEQFVVPAGEVPAGVVPATAPTPEADNDNLPAFITRAA